MGVPGLFPWLKDRFPSARSHFHKDERRHRYRIDNVYLDSNGLLHTAAQIAFNYGAHQRILYEYADLSYEEKRLRCFLLYWEMIEEVCRIVKPVKTVVIAIDGVAPAAKQYQQRQRRFKAAKEQSPNQPFNLAEISPGTPFMLELTKFIHGMIRLKIEHEWKGVEVIFSPPTVPGEGEHTCMNYIRSLPEKRRMDESHCLFGPDGDLIMLTLAAHVPKMFLFRQDLEVPGHYDLLDMGLVRKQMGEVFHPERDLDDLSDDFILIGFLVGNDFLPPIKVFKYIRDGLNKMNQIYAKCRSPLTEKVGNSYLPSLKGFTEFVGELARIEPRWLTDQAKEKEKYDPKFADKTLLKYITLRDRGDGHMEFRLDYPAYRVEYYKKAGVKKGDSAHIRKLCLAYLKTIFWVFEYYVNGLPSWRHLFEYHYSPLMGDLSHTLKTLTPQEEKWIGNFELGKPLLPFEQLLVILPPVNAHLLPEPLRPLMTDPDSPLVKSGMYPEEFLVDYEGKTKEHMGVILLPFVDIGVVVGAYQKVCSQLTITYARNSVGRLEKFIYDPTYLIRFRSEYLTINRVHVRKIYL